MQIHTGHKGLAGDARGAVVAVGSFDGIHLGHRAVITFAQSEARLRGAPSGVLTFNPHPRRFFNPAAPRFELAPLRSKARHLYELGLDHLFVLPFDDRLRNTGAADFVSEVLVGGLGISGVVVGSDFRFGAKRQGDVEFLAQAGARHGFTVHCLAPVTAPGGEIYSSSNIRRFIAEGRPRQARHLLGRSWGLHGSVTEADAPLRKLGFRVALDISEYILPKPGIYAAWAGSESATEIDWCPSVAFVRSSPEGERHEPSLALAPAGGEGALAGGGRVWVSFEEYLGEHSSESGSVGANESLQSWMQSALAFLRSDVGGGTKPPSVSLSRARQMQALSLT